MTASMRSENPTGVWSAKRSRWSAGQVCGLPFSNTRRDTTHRDIAYLFLGTWNYEFCVTAVNGTLESAKSNCVVAPHPASG
ncbi:hypothetical protein ACFVRB_42290 [Streptomyces nojiriensis]|uniref:hypothetical protein n=1 Tax=Streptomyces nojiriensis TaxID=66374 RepID=UPI0036DF6927